METVCYMFPVLQGTGASKLKPQLFPSFTQDHLCEAQVSVPFSQAYSRSCLKREMCCWEIETGNSSKNAKKQNSISN